jgi:hypothetical protein
MVDRPHFSTESPQTWWQHKGGSEEEYSGIIEVIHGRKAVGGSMWRSLAFHFNASSTSNMWELTYVA